MNKQLSSDLKLFFGTIGFILLVLTLWNLYVQGNMQVDHTTGSIRPVTGDEFSRIQHKEVQRGTNTALASFIESNEIFKMSHQDLSNRIASILKQGFEIHYGYEPLNISIEWQEGVNHYGYGVFDGKEIDSDEGYKGVSAGF